MFSISCSIPFNVNKNCRQVLNLSAVFLFDIHFTAPVEYMEPKFLRKVFQKRSSCDAVTFLIKCRAEDADTHFFIDCGYQTSAHSTLGRDAHVYGELTGTVVHAACQHDGLDGVDSFCFEETSFCSRIDAVVGEDQSQICQTLCMQIVQAGKASASPASP